VDDKHHYEWPWSVAGSQEGDSEVKCTQTKKLELEPGKPVTGGLTRKQRARFYRIVDIPTPDYTKIPPKVDCWRREPKNGVQNKKVSMVMTCSMVQIRRRISPKI
jgi:hypothetical protein